MQMRRGDETAGADPASPPLFGLCVTLAAAFTTTFMLESVRVFMSYLVFVVDQSQRIELAEKAGGTFALIALGGVLGRYLGVRVSVAFCVIALLAARLVIQFTEAPDARLWFGAGVVVLWGWMLPNLRALSPDDTARGIVFGLLLDLTIRFGFGSVDLPWMPSGLRNAVTIILAVLLALVLPGALFGRRPLLAGGGGPALIAIGPALVTFQLLIGNLGLLEVKSSLPIQAMALLAAVGLISGFGMQIVPSSGSDGHTGPTALPLALVMTAFAEVLLVVIWRWNGVADFLIAILAGTLCQILIIATRGRGSAGESPELIRDGLWLTLGMLVHAALIFAYYANTGFPALIFVGLGLAGLCVAFVARRGQAIPSIAGRVFVRWLALTGTLLLFGALLIDRSAWEKVSRDDALGSNVTVMTYNIQTGFSRDNVWDLEATARVIEDQQPDVVILQEISRGWVITSGVDQAQWLSRRLNMNLAWGPSSNDGLWGVAILSKGKILASQMSIYSSTENLRRGLLGTAIQTDNGGTLYVYATHLDNPSDAGNVRMEQVDQLIALTNGQVPAIVGGDFNATPDSDVVAAMTAADFVDTGTALPPDTPTSEDGSRIDYIFIRGAITADSVTVPDTWASDHRPLVARLTLN
jgi:endonuclease/exonuclease/phosphatase family metal-dependent hydrolase